MKEVIGSGREREREVYELWFLLDIRTMQWETQANHKWFRNRESKKNTIEISFNFMEPQPHIHKFLEQQLKQSQKNAEMFLINFIRFVHYKILWIIT